MTIIDGSNVKIRMELQTEIEMKIAMQIDKDIEIDKYMEIDINVTYRDRRWR